MPLQILRRLLAVLAGNKTTGQAPASNFSRPVPGSTRSRLPTEQLVGRQDGTPLVAGSFQIVDFSDVRDAMGAAWPDMCGAAQNIMAEELDTGLGPDDSCQPVGECAFVVCFADGDADRSNVRADAIADRIRARLAQELPRVAGHVGVERFVATVDRQAISGSPLPVAQALLSSLEAIRAEAGEADRGQSISLVNDTRVLFQPCWHRKTGSVGLNRSLLDPVVGRSILRQLRSSNDPAGSLHSLAELDCAVFTKSVAAIHAVSRRGVQPAAVLVPVQQSTLANLQTRNVYFHLLDALPPTYRRLVLLEVIPSARRTGSDRLREVLEALREKAERVVLRVAPGDDRMVYMLSSLLWGVSVDLAELFPGTGLTPLRSLIRATQTLELQVAAFGTNTLAAMQSAEAADFDFVAGGAVHLICDMPRPQGRYNPHVGLGESANQESQRRVAVNAVADPDTARAAS